VRCFGSVWATEPCRGIDIIVAKTEVSQKSLCTRIQNRNATGCVTKIMHTYASISRHPSCSVAEHLWRQYDIPYG
jgi:hypothetical protein